MTKEQLLEKRKNLVEGITAMRQQAGELEVALRRNEGALLMVDHLLEEMDGETQEETPASE